MKNTNVVIHRTKIDNPNINDFWLDDKGFLKTYRETKGWIVIAILKKENDYLKSLYHR